MQQHLISTEKRKLRARIAALEAQLLAIDMERVAMERVAMGLAPMNGDSNVFPREKEPTLTPKPKTEKCRPRVVDFSTKP